MVRRRVTALVAVALGVLCALPGSAGASGTQQSILMDDGQLLYHDAAHTEQVMETLHALGVDTVKVSVTWSLVAPNPDSARRPRFDAADPAAYPPGAWDRYDNVVRDAHGLGMRLYFQFTGGTPRWAWQAGLPRGEGKSLGQAPNDHELALFAEAVGRRYSGSYLPAAPAPRSTSPTLTTPVGLTVTAPGMSPSTSEPAQAPPLPAVREWGIWNEPNFPSWLNPFRIRLRDGVTEVSQPALYRGIVDAVWAGLTRTGHARDTILLGETANFGNVDSTNFVRDLYCVGPGYTPLSGRAAEAVGCPTRPSASAFERRHPGLFGMSGWAHHPYGFDRAPNLPYPLKGWYTLSNLGALERLLDRTLGAYGRMARGGVPLYLSEWGYKTNPPNPYVKTTAAQQSLWLNQGEYMTWQMPFVKGLNQFLLVDSGPLTQYPVGSQMYWHTWQTGLETDDGTPKPSFYSYPVPIWVPHPHPGPRVLLWAKLRPADHAHTQYAVLEYRTGSAGSWEGLRELETNSPGGYIVAHVAVPGRGQLRLAWLSSSGDIDYSRTISIR